MAKVLPLFALKASITALIFAIGMSATMSDITYIWRRSVLFGKSLFARYVVVPLVAVLMARGLDLPWGTGVALVVLGICAGAPLLPKKVVEDPCEWCSTWRAGAGREPMTPGCARRAGHCLEMPGSAKHRTPGRKGRSMS